MPVGLDAGDEHAANLELAWAGDDVVLALHRRGVVMAGRLVADRDDLGAQLEGLVSGDLVIVWVGDHGSHAALGQAKTGKSVPGNLHVYE